MNDNQRIKDIIQEVLEAFESYLKCKHPDLLSQICFCIRSIYTFQGFDHEIVLKGKRYQGDDFVVDGSTLYYKKSILDLSQSFLRAALIYFFIFFFLKKFHEKLEENEFLINLYSFTVDVLRFHKAEKWKKFEKCDEDDPSVTYLLCLLRAESHESNELPIKYKGENDLRLLQLSHYALSKLAKFQLSPENESIGARVFARLLTGACPYPFALHRSGLDDVVLSSIMRMGLSFPKNNENEILEAIAKCLKGMLEQSEPSLLLGKSLPDSSLN